MKLMHKLTVKEPKQKILVSLWSFFFFCFFVVDSLSAAVARYLKMRRVELSWSSLNEHLINHPYNASLFSSCSLLLFPTCLCRSPFRYLQKKSLLLNSFHNFFLRRFFLWSVDCWWQLKYLKKSTSSFQSNFYSSSTRCCCLFIPRSMVCDNG